jgi:hypothetical protein
MLSESQDALMCSLPGAECVLRKRGDQVSAGQRCKREPSGGSRRTSTVTPDTSPVPDDRERDRLRPGHCELTRSISITYVPERTGEVTNDPSASIGTGTELKEPSRS